MATTLVALAAEIETDAAAIATEIGGGRTTAEIQALAEFLRVCSLMPSVNEYLVRMPAADRANLSVA